MQRYTRRLMGGLPAVLLLATPLIAQAPPGNGQARAFATVTLSFTNNGEPLNESEHGKFYIHAVGEPKNYIDWGHAGRSARVPVGVYDLILRYENGDIAETITRKKFVLTGDHEEVIGFRVPIARLKVDITRAGTPIEPFTGTYSVYRSGQRGSPLARKRPGTEITIRPGTYDIEVIHRGGEGIKTQWVEGLHVEGITHETVDLGLPRSRIAQLTLTMTQDGKRILPDAGAWRVYDVGQRATPLVERRSGEMLSIEKGVYDIGAFYTVDGVTREHWLTEVEFTGDQERELEMGPPLATLRVNVNDGGGRILPDAWFSVYKVGQRDSALLTAGSGGEVRVEPGTYDIGCFLREGGAHADQWLLRRELREPLTLDVDLKRDDTSLRVLPQDRRARGSDGTGPRLLILLDSSSRMQNGMAGSSRLNVAVPAIAEGLSGLPAAMQVGLRAVGGDPLADSECRASSLQVALGSTDAEALTDALSRLQPAGAAPVAYALEQAVADVTPGPDNTLLLLTSGADDCGGDLCVAASRLLRNGTVGRIFVIGFDMDRDQLRRLDCAGEQHAAGSALELTAALGSVIRATLRAEDGTVAVFSAGRPAWIAGGAVGDTIKLNSGTYDVLIRSQGRTFEWTGVKIEGQVEAVAGRRFGR